LGAAPAGKPQTSRRAVIDGGTGTRRVKKIQLPFSDPSALVLIPAALWRSPAAGADDGLDPAEGGEALIVAAGAGDSAEIGGGDREHAAIVKASTATARWPLR